MDVVLNVSQLAGDTQRLRMNDGRHVGAPSQHTLYPVAPFGIMAAYMPEAREGKHHSHRHFRVRVRSPFERGAYVAELYIQAFEPHGLVRTLQLRLRLLG